MVEMVGGPMKKIVAEVEEDKVLLVKVEMVLMELFQLIRMVVEELMVLVVIAVLHLCMEVAVEVLVIMLLNKMELMEFV